MINSLFQIIHVFVSLYIHIVIGSLSSTTLICKLRVYVYSMCSIEEEEGGRSQLTELLIVEWSAVYYRMCQTSRCCSTCHVTMEEVKQTISKRRAADEFFSVQLQWGRAALYSNRLLYLFTSLYGFCWCLVILYLLSATYNI